MEGKNEQTPAVRAVFARLSAAFTELSRKKGMAFTPSPTDVIITTGRKSGTAWLQQICHGLRSRGNMDFDEIALVVPFLEAAHDYGYEDLQAPQPFSPRMFKTHAWYPSCPKGAGKYIVVTRRPADSALSFFHFLEHFLFEEGTFSAEEFIEAFYLKMGVPKSIGQFSSQIHHIWSWYPHRHDKNVLWLHYEDLIDNLQECVRLIAQFLDIGSEDEELQELVTHQASFDFMKSHKTKFDSHLIRIATNIRLGQPKDAGLEKNAGNVRLGKANVAKDVLSTHTIAKIQEKWKEIMTADTGYETYEAMREGINKELGRDFS